MPPDAISCSSTYLPKIWGNIAHSYGSALALVSLLFLGCAPEPAQELRIRAYGFSACPVADTARLQLFALGDFDTSNRTVEAVGAGAGDRELVLPFATRAVAARSAAGMAGWHGLAERAGNAIDLLLWPNSGACALYRSSAEATDAYRVADGGQALGVSKSQATLLVAGGVNSSNGPLASSPDALYADLRTGVATPVRAEFAMHQARAYATVTEFGTSLLVAGGADSLEQGAEVFDPKLKRFDRLIRLSLARSRHAAVVLVSGETLLIGGSSSGSTLPRRLELVSPKTGESRIAGLPVLDTGRAEPSAVRLDDGRVLIAGGYDIASDRALSPVASFVWLSPDAARIELNVTPIPARYNRALVAMPGGSALAVGGCEDRAPDGDEDCRIACGALPPDVDPNGPARGCPARSSAGEARYDAWWITAEGTATPLPDLPAGTSAGSPTLVAASDGAPWLIAGQQVLRFEPWTGSFKLQSAVTELSGGNDLPPPLAIDSGAFVWLTKEARGHVVLQGLRHDTRGRFASDVPLFFGGTEHTAPNRSPAPLGNYVPSVSYAEGLLHLGSRFAAAFVTDTTYENLHLEIKLRAGPPPIVLLGQRQLGTFDCLWPSAKSAGQEELLVVDRVAEVAVLRRAQELTTCSVPAGRLSVGLSGSSDSDETIVSKLSVSRTLPD